MSISFFRIVFAAWSLIFLSAAQSSGGSPSIGGLDLTRHFKPVLAYREEHPAKIHDSGHGKVAVELRAAIDVNLLQRPDLQNAFRTFKPA